MRLKPAVDGIVESMCEDGHQMKIDVLRAIRDYANLLFERQKVIEMLDDDPFDQLGNHDWTSLKTELEVLDCHRQATSNGHKETSVCTAVIRISQQSKIDLLFSFERRPMTESDFADLSRAPTHFLTHIIYFIELRTNHGRWQRLVAVDVWAENKYPSQQPALPIMPLVDNVDSQIPSESDQVGKEEDTDRTTSQEPHRKKLKIESDETRTTPTTSDRFAVYLDPDILSDFLNCCGTEVDEWTALHLLFTFPFYEHEFDLAGFAIETIFGQDEDGDGGEDISDDTGPSENDNIPK